MNTTPSAVFRRVRLRATAAVRNKADAKSSPKRGAWLSIRCRCIAFGILLGSNCETGQTSLDYERHLHVAVSGAAVVVTDRGKGARFVRGDGDFRRLTRIGVEIDVQRLDEEAMRAVAAGETDRDRLVLRELDDI